MSIPAAHSHRFIYHSTHINNLEHILRHGLLSHNQLQRLGLSHHTIAEDSIQQRRAQMQVPCGPGGVVHDYVPLYFTKLSPMLLKQVNAKNVDQILLLHIAFSITILDRFGLIFTDAAANSSVPPRFFSDPADLEQLRWDAIDSPKWGSTVNGVDVKHQRMAEALAHVSLEPGDAAFMVVWNESIKEQVKAIYDQVGVTPPQLRFDGPGEHHLFTNFRANLPDDMRNKSIASGPIFIKHYFDTVIQNITTSASPPQTRFPSLAALLAALRTDGLSALPETLELIDLESQNEVHREDVGTHTILVVSALLSSPEFAALPPDVKDIVELAAYLHDIGKGPKSRWAKCDGKQQVDADHPIRSLEMLPRILREEVELTVETATLLCKLVCYHDLVGDIIGRNRHRDQLVEVAATTRDLDALIALGKADMTAVVASWGGAATAHFAQLRTWAAGQLRS